MSTWSTRFTEDEWLAEQRPATQRLGWMMAGSWLIVVVALAFYWMSQLTLGLVIAAFAACMAAFPTTAFLAMRRSYLRVRVNFRAASVWVDEVRSFEPSQEFRASIVDVTCAVQDQVVLLRWVEEPETGLDIDVGSKELAERIVTQFGIARGR